MRHKSLFRCGFLTACAWLCAPAGAADIQDLVNAVSQSQFQTYQLAVERMGLGLFDANYGQGVRNRDGWAGAGSLGNQETRAYLGGAMSSFGLSTALQGSYYNVIGELPGRTDANRVYIVCGHYDHVNSGTQGQGSRPGGDDNASGVAGVLEAARILSQYQFDYTIRFIGFNAEEDGLLGSKNYVNNVITPEHQDVDGVIALDMILRPGWDEPTTDAKDGGRVDIDLGTRTGYSQSVAWATQFRSAAATYVPSLVVDATFNVSGGSDQDPFVTAGLPAFVAIENTANEIWGGGANKYYHTASDASDSWANDANNPWPGHVTYDYAFATEVVQATVALIAQEAHLIPEPTTAVALLAAAGLAARRRKVRRTGQLV